MTDQPLPQAIDAEQAIIGTCLFSPEAINSILSELKPEMFYLESNKQLYTAISEVAKKNGKADLISITDYLRVKGQLDGFGGVIGLMKRTENIVTDHYLSDYVKIVREKHVLREYIFAGAKLANLAYVEDLADVVEYAESTLFEISNFIQQREPKRIDKIVDAYLAEIEKIVTKQKTLTGIPSGITVLDRITGGWQPSDLVIIAGRPSMGKTAVALSLAQNTSSLNYPVAFFSLEMSETQLAGRLLSGVSGKTNIELRAGKVDLMELGSQSNEIAMLPLFIDDTPAISLFDLRSKIKKLIVKEQIHLVVVDYLQLMTCDAQSREQEVSKISRGLKSIAKEFNIPVIALAQLNREVESRADKKPRLSDLRESGSIEQDADIVCFIYRPAVYGIRDITLNGENFDTNGLLVFDIAKNRNGALASLPLYHNEALTKIRDDKN